MGEIRNLNGGGNGQQAGVNINPQDLEDYLCLQCGNQTFVPVMVFKTLSAVLSPTGKLAMVPLEVYKCDECNNIIQEMLPKSSKSDSNE
jgi:hypothetical protein